MTSLILLLVLCCLVGIAPIIFKIGTRNFDPFDLRIGFLLYLTVQVGVAGFFPFLLDSPAEFGLDPNYHWDAYAKGICISILGILSFQLGAFAFSPKIRRSNLLRRRQWTQGQAILLLLGWTAVSLLPFKIFLDSYGGIAGFLEQREVYRATGTIGTGIYTFPLVQGLSLLSTALLISRLNERSRMTIMSRILSAILLVSSLAPGALLGFRGAMLPVLVQYAVVYHYLGKRLAWSRLVLFGVLTGVIFTGYGIIREIPEDTPLAQGAVDIIQKKPEALISFLGRSRGTEVIASVVDRIDNDSVYGGLYPMFIEAASIWIPGELWASKPLPQGIQFTTTFFLEDLNRARKWNADQIGGISPTIVGELYWHLGIFAVLIGCFLWGRIGAIVYETFSATNSSFSLLCYSVFFVHYVWAAESLQGALNTLVLKFLVMIIFYVLLCMFPRTNEEKYGSQNALSQNG